MDLWGIETLIKVVNTQNRYEEMKNENVKLDRSEAQEGHTTNSIHKTLLRDTI